MSDIYNFFLKPKQEFDTMEFSKVVGNILHNLGMISFTQFLHNGFALFDEEKIETVYEIQIFHDLTIKEKQAIKDALSRISEVKIVEHVVEDVEVV